VPNEQLDCLENAINSKRKLLKEKLLKEKRKYNGQKPMTNYSQQKTSEPN
jgi:hypothetical protein